MKDREHTSKDQVLEVVSLVKLTREQVKRIDELLADIGDYGELHIIIEHGSLKYVNKVESYKFTELIPKKQ